MCLCCDCKLTGCAEFNQLSVAIFTVQRTLLIAVRAYCAPLTYSHCDFSAVINSLAEWIELQGVKGKKAEGVRMSTFLSVLPFSVHSWLRSGVCTLRCRRQSGHAAETAGAAYPSPQQPTQQLANA